MRSDGEAGPILVVPKDGRPLHPLHFEAICLYCIDVIEDIARGREEVDDELRYAQVMDKISRESFMELWGQLHDVKREDGSLGVDEVIKSPYEV